MEDPFRYKIIIENEEDQKTSKTSQITSYYIKNVRTNTVYRLIDTPGFGDTGGI
jgi:GTP-binding protein EngB required for normal cell division